MRCFLYPNDPPMENCAFSPFFSNPFAGGMSLKKGFNPGMSFSSFFTAMNSFTNASRSSLLFSLMYAGVMLCFPGSLPLFSRRSLHVALSISPQVTVSLTRSIMPMYAGVLGTTIAVCFLYRRSSLSVSRTSGFKPVVPFKRMMAILFTCCVFGALSFFSCRDVIHEFPACLIFVHTLGARALRKAALMLQSTPSRD